MGSDLLLAAEAGVSSEVKVWAGKEENHTIDEDQLNNLLTD